MQVYYEEKAGQATFNEDGIVVSPFTATRLSIRWVSGAATLEYSFDGSNTHGKIAPDADPDGAYPNEVVFKTEGVSKVWLKNTSVTVAVRFWR